MFRYGIPGILLALQILVYFNARAWARTQHAKRPWVLRTITLLFLLFDLPLVGMMLIRMRLNEIPEWFIISAVYPFYVWHLAMLLIGIVVLVRSLIRLISYILLWIPRQIRVPAARMQKIAATPSFQKFDASRRMFIRRSMYGVTGLSFGASVYGLIEERSSVEFTEAEYVLPGLGAGMSGFTIALISDIHSSIFMTKEDMDRYVRLVNGLKADMIVVDGDFVNGAVEEVYPFAEAFSNLSAPFGVHGVMGNHDFYNNDPELVARTVDACGVRLLRNDKTVIEKNGSQFYLIGVDDIGRATNAPVKLDTAIGHAPLQIPKILLCHRPYYLPQAAARNIDLVLSGHTHGGQIVLGRIGDMTLALASLASRYIWGNYTFNRTSMYVSRGVGTVGPPMRLNCPPEITKITLRSS